MVDLVRGVNAAFFDQHLEGVLSPVVREGATHVYHQYTIQIDPAVIAQVGLWAGIVFVLTRQVSLRFRVVFGLALLGGDKHIDFAGNVEVMTASRQTSAANR